MIRTVVYHDEVSEASVSSLEALAALDTSEGGRATALVGNVASVGTSVAVGAVAGGTVVLAVHHVQSGAGELGCNRARVSGFGNGFRTNKRPCYIHSVKGLLFLE